MSDNWILEKISARCFERTKAVESYKIALTMIFMFSYKNILYCRIYKCVYKRTLIRRSYRVSKNGQTQEVKRINHSMHCITSIFQIWWLSTNIVKLKVFSQKITIVWVENIPLPRKCWRKVESISVASISDRYGKVVQEMLYTCAKDQTERMTVSISLHSFWNCAKVT